MLHFVQVPRHCNAKRGLASAKLEQKCSISRGEKWVVSFSKNDVHQTLTCAQSKIKSVCCV